MPAALLAASLLVSQMFSLSCARVQNSRAVGRTRRARACQVPHGTCLAGSRLSSWARAMGARGARSASGYFCVLSVLDLGKKSHLPSSLASACHQRACLLPRFAANPAAHGQPPCVNSCENEPLFCEDEEANTSAESSSSSPSMFTCLLPPVLGSDGTVGQMHLCRACGEPRYISVAVYAAPAPMIEYVAPAPAVSYTAPTLPVYAEPLPVVNCISTASQQSVTQYQLPSTRFRNLCGGDNDDRHRDSHDWRLHSRCVP